MEQKQQSVNKQQSITLLKNMVRKCCFEILLVLLIIVF